ncbi:MAG: purine-nucleoside phosphorylase [Deltaproteobacteria bacterium]|nr:purine-nucleoside phosphorylase [Deltaproteobacteria bacterium]
MSNLYAQTQESVQVLRRVAGVIPDVALILGTGLGGVAERISVRARIPYNEIPHFPAATAKGHEGMLLFGSLAGLAVVAMQGRFHFYEGYGPEQVTLPVRVLRGLGARILIINSAAGGLNPTFEPGDVMVATDHISLMMPNPLRGVVDERLGPRFPDMSHPYDAELIRAATEAAAAHNIAVRQGVYIAVPGPSLETPAETRMLRLLKADAVGMSTVPEVIVANQVGFRTLALAAITNVNDPDKMEPISVQKVIDNAAKAGPTIGLIIEEILRRMKMSLA